MPNGSAHYLVPAGQQQRETYSTARPGAPLREVSRVVQLSGVYLFGSQPLVPTIGAAEPEES